MNPWYEKGLYFKCTGCGRCCSGSPGYVWVNAKEAQALADFLGISVEEFIKKYTRRVGDRLSLKETLRDGNYDCVFLKNNRCQVYGARPKQCCTYPWWKENIETPAHWEEAALLCEGINHPDAPLISLSEIQKELTR